MMRSSSCWREQGFLVLAFFDGRAQLGSVHQHDVACGIGFVQKQNRDVRAGGGEDIARHRNHAAQHFILHQFLADFLFDAALGGQEAGRDDDGGFAFGRQRIDDVLDKEQVDRHLVFAFWA